MPKRIISVLASIILIQTSLLAQPDLRFAELGNFRLANGGIIQNCRVAYRICGRLNSDRSNAVLFPTAFRGTTERRLNYVGEGKFVDTTKYFVILVDAFGNGLSSSPSNSTIQPDSLFPYFSIHDLVQSQYLLLTEFLKINQLYAVIGISMGGMQAFEWAVSYPQFAKRVIPIVGSPRLAPFDLLLWKTQSHLIEECLRLRCEDTGLLLSMTGNLLNTPEYFNRQHSREGVDSLIGRMRTSGKSSFNGHNVLRQLRAMITHDVSSPFDGSLEKAAQKVVSDLFVIVASQDRVVTPEPARKFAKLLGSRILELESDCGHGAFSCELARISEALGQFFSGVK